MLVEERGILNISSVLKETTRVVESSTSAFQKAARSAYNEIIADSGISCGKGESNNNTNCFSRKRVDFARFAHKSNGGLSDEDREVIGDLYYNADSVFEFGVGESTAIAAATNVPRFTGVDSDAQWVAKARSLAPDRYRFYFADVGNTRVWGYPVDPALAKMSYDYQIEPLFAELKPFDVYTVDGRWRVACVMASFLHAMDTGGNLSATRVYIHDYLKRPYYDRVTTVSTIVNSTGIGVVLALKQNVTEDDVYNVWKVRTS